MKMRITGIMMVTALAALMSSCESDSDDSYVVVGTMTVSPRAEGVTYTPDVPGTYKFTIDGGAYSTGDGMWMTALYGYSDRPVATEENDGRQHPTQPDVTFGDFTKEATPEAAEAVGKGSAAALSITDYAVFIVADDLGTFGDNSGSLNLVIARRE
jgi:hypothetical protein